MLSGKHLRTTPPPEGTRFTLGTAAQAHQDRYGHDREFDTVETLRQLAGRAGVSLVTLAVAWVLANPAVTAPIIGASRPEQLERASWPPATHWTVISANWMTSLTATAWVRRQESPPTPARNWIVQLPLPEEPEGSPRSGRVGRQGLEP